MVEPTNRNPRHSEVGRQRVGDGRGGRDLAAPGCRAGGGPVAAARGPPGSDRTSRTRRRPGAARRRCRWSRRSWPGCARSRHRPSAASRSASSKAATTCGSKPLERRPEGLALAQDRRPRQARLERFEREPLEQLDVVMGRDAPFVVVVGDHQRVGRGSVGGGPGAARAGLDHPAHDSRVRGSARGRTACCAGSDRSTVGPC